MVKNLNEKTSLKNLPSARENKAKNNRMIDKALEKEGIPIPHNKYNLGEDEDSSNFSESAEEDSP